MDSSAQNRTPVCSELRYAESLTENERHAGASPLVSRLARSANCEPPVTGLVFKNPHHGHVVAPTNRQIVRVPQTDVTSSKEFLDAPSRVRQRTATFTPGLQ